MARYRATRTTTFKEVLRPLFASAAVLAFLLAAPSSQALLLSNGSLDVDIRSDNGTINSVVFAGAEFYQRGTVVANWGLQNDTIAPTFAINAAAGFTGIPVSVSSPPGSIAVSGTYTGGGANVAFTRTYALLSGLNVLRVTTQLTNNGSDLTLSYFDSLDPDQGIDLGFGYATYNDVFPLGAATVAQARTSTELTVIMGSSDPAVTIASGSPFSLNTGVVLNTFFSSPVDANDALADAGTHVGFRFLLAAGASRTIQYDQAYGTTIALARATFIAAQSCGDNVVDPGEQCDDGNLLDGDGCDFNCTLTACGNGILTTGEVCDDGNFDNNDECTNVCRINVCGDGFARTGLEVCDDGNLDDGDGCDSSCTPSGCGNGVITAGEACDDGNFSNQDSCTNECVANVCGDGFVNAGVEVCDDGNRVDNDTCTNDCAPNVCGDGVIDSGTGNYVVTPTPYNWIDISGVETPLPLGDDEVSAPIPLGFSFAFFDKVYSQVRVSSNGFVTFNDADDSGCCSGAALPTPGGPENLIAAFWADLFPPGAGGYSYAQIGNVFVIQASSVLLAGGSLHASFQIQLHQSGNRIEIHYQEAQPGSQTVTAGIENADGSIGLQHYSNLDGALLNQAVAYMQVDACDDGNTLDGDGCSSTCAAEPCWICTGEPSTCGMVDPGTLCADDGNACTQDVCDNLGACSHTNVPVDTACSSDANDCTRNSCDGAGLCTHAALPVDTACGSDGIECTQDVCDGAGSCIHPPVAADSACGDPSNTECDHPDSCDGEGSCVQNFQPSSEPCTDDHNPCTQDFCDGSGACAHANEGIGTDCGDASDTQCTHPDTCDGVGGCQPNHELAGTPCGSAASSECDAADGCDGAGDCVVNNVADGTPCFGSNGNSCRNGCQNGTCASTVIPSCCGNGTLEAGELCDDDNQISDDECTASCRLRLDNFQCYRTAVVEAQPASGHGVLFNQFHTIKVLLGKPKAICNPADKDGEDPSASSHVDHLETYPITTTPRRSVYYALLRRDIKVVNQLGTIYVDATWPKDLLVPTAMELDSLPAPLDMPGVDHFTCYKVKRSKNRPRFKPMTGVDIEDQFGKKKVTVLRPSRVCLPTNKDYDNPGVQKHMAQLMCYRVRGAFRTPGRVFANNQYGPGQLYVRFPNELCVPSVRNPN
jgi:cysteine-rich repeat protein